MDDDEDVKKLTILLQSQANCQDFQYDDFINCENSDSDESEDSVSFEDSKACSYFNNEGIPQSSSESSVLILKPEEASVIESCTDPELKNLLILNRKKYFQRMQLYKCLKDLLLQCQKDIIGKSEDIMKFLKASSRETHASGAWRLAAPYFKTKKLYICPPNADTVRKREKKELSVYDFSVPRKWSNRQCQNVIQAVKLNYNMNQQKELIDKVHNLKKNGEAKNKGEVALLTTKLEELMKEDNLKLPPLNSDQYIDWLRVTDKFLGDKRTSFECQSFWHIYLHPDINKSPWTPEEDEKLKACAKKHDYQRWDDIAKELNNGRTAFTACVHYFSELHEIFKKGEFTRTEDAALLDLVQKHKMGSYIPWFKIAQHFKNRTRAQLHHRYMYYLSQKDKKRGKFTDAEDVLLMVLVDKFGKNFRKCCEYLPTRSTVQVRARYNSNLQQRLKKGTFTLDEDRIIMKYVEENGDRSWTKLTGVLGRCRGQIRQRYNTIATFLQSNPQLKLESVPRRKHKISEEDDSFNLLRKVADEFRDSPVIPTLAVIEQVLTRHGQEKLLPLGLGNVTTNTCSTSGSANSIDDMLTNFFSNSFAIPSSKSIPAKHVTEAVRNVKRVLDVLQVKLRLPRNFSKDKRLDRLDVEILNRLTEVGVTHNQANSNRNELLQPNLNTLLSVRNLLVIYCGNGLNDKTEIRQFFVSTRGDLMNRLIGLSDTHRRQIESDCTLFFQRFQSLFKWPAVLTLQKPTTELQSSSDHHIIRNSAIQVKRTYGRKGGPLKRLKLSELPGTSTNSVPLKLMPVTSTSVIQDLLLNKDKKLFSIKAVRCMGETKTVIKEVKFPSNVKRQTNETASIDLISDDDDDRQINLTPTTDEATDESRLGMDCMEEDVDVEDEDMCDLKKLNNILKDSEEMWEDM